jgi:cytochrome b
MASAAGSGTEQARTIRLWDWPVRLFHWLAVLIIPAMWWTAENGEMARHKQLGVLFLALLLTRIGWGFVGSDPARFANFLRGPGAVIAYLRGAPQSAPGHNPLGGWSIAALFLILAGQMGLGLIAQDVDALEPGPLNHLVSYETAEAAREWHELGFDLILAWVALHLSAIIWHYVRHRDNLVGPMLSGNRRVAADVAEPKRGRPALLLLCMAAAAGLSAWVWLGAPPLGG